MTSPRLLTLAVSVVLLAVPFAGCLQDDAPAAQGGTPTPPVSPSADENRTTEPPGEEPVEATPTPPPDPQEPVLVTPTPSPTPPPPVAGSACVDGEPALGATAGKPRVALDTSLGTIILELEREKVPITVGNFLNLTSDGFYDGTLFHRVIGPAKSPPNGFMIQGGDPLSKDEDPANDGTGGPDHRIPDEFHPDLRHAVGVLSMANSGPNTGGSQFFITLTSTPWLDDKHAVFGRVVEGMSVVRAIAAVETDSGDRPTTPVRVEAACVDEPDTPAPEPSGAVLGAHVVIAEKRTEAGRPVTFAVVAENRADARMTLAVAPVHPAGWTWDAEAAPPRVVNAGASRVFLLTILPPEHVNPGTYNLSVDVVRRDGMATVASVPLTVHVGGLGAAAAAGSSVVVNYVGMLEDGRLFDTSVEAVAKNPAMGKSAFWGSDDGHRYQTFEFTVGSGVIEGFSELATGAKVGETRVALIPPEKAYGARGSELSGRALVFELEVVEVPAS